MNVATFDGTYRDFTQPIIRGNDYTFTFTARTPNAGAVPNAPPLQPYDSSNSVVTDLTDWSAFWCTGKLGVALPGADDTAALFQVTMAGGGISVNSPATAGIGTVTLPASITAALPPGTDAQPVFVDVKGKDSAGKEHTLCTGKLLVRAGVTQSA